MEVDANGIGIGRDRGALTKCCVEKCFAADTVELLDVYDMLSDTAKWLR